MKLIACSIIVLAGAACFSSGTSGNVKDVGMLIMAIGGVFFLLEYFRSWKSPE